MNAYIEGIRAESARNALALLPLPAPQHGGIPGRTIGALNMSMLLLSFSVISTHTLMGHVPSFVDRAATADAAEGTAAQSVASSAFVVRPLDDSSFENSTASAAMQRRKRRAILRLRERAAKGEAVRIPPPSIFATKEKPFAKAGIFLTANSIARDAFFEESLDKLQESGGDALIFDVKGSYVYFHTSSPLADELSLKRPLYELPDILLKAEERGIYTIARFIAIKDTGLTQSLPDSRIKNPRTERVISPYWIDPTHPKALEYNMQVLCDIASHGIDEVNFDYIRYDTKVAGALGVYSKDEKVNKLEVFIRAARATVNRCNPDTKLGISTFAILGWDNYDENVKHLGQDIVKFAPYVDIISPMIYPMSFSAEGGYYKGHKNGRMYSLVYDTLKGHEEILGEEHREKIRPWLQGFWVNERDIRNQIQAVYDSGFCGYTVWNADNYYAPTYGAMQKVKVPQTCL